MTDPVKLFLLRAALVIALVALVSFTRTPRYDDASFPVIDPGCKADLLVGWLDCFYRFPDGTWYRSRSY